MSQAALRAVVCARHVGLTLQRPAPLAHNQHCASVAVAERLPVAWQHTAAAAARRRCHRHCAAADEGGLASSTRPPADEYEDDEDEAECLGDRQSSSSSSRGGRQRSAAIPRLQGRLSYKMVRAQPVRWRTDVAFVVHLLVGGCELWSSGAFGAAHPWRHYQ